MLYEYYKHTFPAIIPVYHKICCQVMLPHLYFISYFYSHSICNHSVFFIIVINFRWTVSVYERCVCLCPFSKALCPEISHSLPCLDLKPVLTTSAQCFCGNIRTGEDNRACFSVFLLWIMMKQAFGCNFRRPCDYLCVFVQDILFCSCICMQFSVFVFCSQSRWCITITFDPWSEAPAAA